MGQVHPCLSGRALIEVSLHLFEFETGVTFGASCCSGQSSGPWIVGRSSGGSPGRCI